MCSNFLSNCFKAKLDEIKYSELNEVEDKHTIYPILECIYKSHYIQVSKPYECNITINRDSIHLKTDTIKFDYISHFKMISDRSIGIIMFTRINKNLIMIKNDSLSMIIVKFTSNNSRQTFMNTIFKQIKLYKSYNNYDKSVYNFKMFKNLTLKKI